MPAKHNAPGTPASGAAADDRSGEIFEAAFLDGLRPDPLLTVSEWSDEHRYLSQKASAEPGRWRTDRTPYLRAVMDALSPASPVREIVFQKGAQIGATESGLNWIGYVIDHVPGPMMAVSPTVELAKRSSRQRVDPLIDECPRIKEKLSDPKSRDSGNTMLSKDFPGGVLVMTGANSAVGLRSMAARYLFLDEIDAYPDDVDGEGDPISLAEARTRTFSRRKIFKISTPTLDGRSKIAKAFEHSSMQYFEVPCPLCAGMQALEWERVRYKVLGDFIEDVHYACLHCDGKIEEHHKTAMLAKGVWVPRRPEIKDVIGFHLSSLYSPIGWYSWRDAAKDYQKALKDVEKMRTFVNTVLGITWRERGDAPSWNRLYERREDYQVRTVPTGGLVLTAGVDVQRDRLELEIVAWGRDRQSWSIDYIVIPGDTVGEAVWKELATVIDSQYPHEHAGVYMPLKMVAIDSGFNTQQVYQFCRKYSQARVLAVKGQDEMQVLVGQPRSVDLTVKGKRVPSGVKVWPVGVGVAKSELYGWLRLDAPTDGKPYAPGYCHFPEYGPEFFQMLTAEEMQAKIVRGFRRYMWVKVRERNEALDCFDEQTEVLTGSGWKFWKHVLPDDLIGTVNKETDTIEFQKPKKLIRRKHSGEMISFKSGRLDVLVTPNHRMWVNRVRSTESKKAWSDRPDLIPAEQVQPYMALKTRAKGQGSDEPIVLPPYVSNQGYEWWQEKHFDRKDFAAFLGWFFSEGYVAKNTYGTSTRRLVVICQVKVKTRTSIGELLQRLGIEFHKSKEKITITNAAIYEYLKPMKDGCANMRLPKWLFESSPEVIDAFIDAYVAGDGWTDRYGHRTITTTCIRTASDIQRLFVLAGRNAVLRTRKAESIRPSFMRGSVVRSKLDQHNISEIRTKRAYLFCSGGESAISKVHYEGYVYCASMPNDTLIVRRNGKVVITGNCRVYARSAAAVLGIDRWQDHNWESMEIALGVGVAEPEAVAKVENAKAHAPAAKGNEAPAVRKKSSFW